jgi:MOSC domain-containing protein YiiM
MPLVISATDATQEQLDAAVDEIRRAPRDEGRVEMIVTRPVSGERAIVDEGVLDLVAGLVGDNWTTRSSKHTPDGKPHPDTQLTLMNIRAVRVLARDAADWAMAGDQLFVDFDLSPEHLPTGTRLLLGSAELEITDKPHTGCAKFTARFGSAAMRWVNTPTGRSLNLRGIYARVVTGGTVRRGDAIRKR